MVTISRATTQSFVRRLRSPQPPPHFVGRASIKLIVGSPVATSRVPTLLATSAPIKKILQIELFFYTASRFMVSPALCEQCYLCTEINVKVGAASLKFDDGLEMRTLYCKA